MSSSRCVTSLGQPVDEGDQRLDLVRVEGGGQPPDRRRERRERRLVVAEQRLHPADHALGPRHDAVRAGRRPLDGGDGVVGLLAGLHDPGDDLVRLAWVRPLPRWPDRPLPACGRRPRSPRRPWPACSRRPRWPRRPWPGCGPRPRSPRRRVAWVPPTAAMASSARARVASRRVIASSARSTIASTRSSRPETRPSSCSICPTAAPTRGTRASASATPSRTPPTAESTSDGPGSDGSLTRATLRTRSDGPLFGCARRSPVRGLAHVRASGAATARAPVSSGIEHGRGTDDDEKVSTPVGEQPTRDGAGPAASPGAPAGRATARPAPPSR